MRRRLPETLLAPAVGKVARMPPWRVSAAGLALIGCGTIVGYGFDYMTTYAQDALHMPANLAFGATLVLGVVLVVTDVVAGVAADRFGRRRVMLAVVWVMIGLVVPLYALMIHWPVVWVVYGVTGLLGVMEAFVTVPALVAVAELLPAEMRSVALGTIYAVAVSLFGGTTQFMMKWLGDLSGSKLAPACYVTVALAAGAVGMLSIPETQHGKDKNVLF
jgi:MFS family permease